jgi:hypothetical protein
VLEDPFSGGPEPATGGPDTSVAQWSTGDESASPAQAQVGSSRLPAGEQTAFGATTSVDTASIDSFIAYVESLIPELEQGRDSLSDVNVQPGAFVTADTMRTKINGGSGLAGQFEVILSDMVNGVVSISTAMSQLRTTYSDVEAMNNMSASDLQTQFQQVGQYFSGVVSDAGGSSGPASSSSSASQSSSQTGSQSSSSSTTGS